MSALFALSTGGNALASSQKINPQPLPPGAQRSSPSQNINLPRDGGQYQGQGGRNQGPQFQMPVMAPRPSQPKQLPPDLSHLGNEPPHLPAPPVGPKPPEPIHTTNPIHNPNPSNPPELGHPGQNPPGRPGPNPPGHPGFNPPGHAGPNLPGHPGSNPPGHSHHHHRNPGNSSGNSGHNPNPEHSPNPVQPI